MTGQLQGQDLPRLVAHRGYPQRYPENTLLSLSKALEAGAEFVEFDVQLTRDGVPVLLHDADLRRMAGVDLTVTEEKLEALLAHELNEPERFGETFSGVRLATLAEVVALLKRFPGVTAFVEIKRASLRRFGSALVVKRILRDLAGAQDQCVPISFAAEALRQAQAAGAARVGWVIEPYSAKVRREAEALRPQFLFVDHEILPARSPLWPGPWTWVAYTINSPQPLRGLAARGVALVETDAFGEMLASLGPGAQPRGG